MYFTSSSGKSSCLAVMLYVMEFFFTVMYARLSCTSSLLKSFMLRNFFLVVQKLVYMLFKVTSARMIKEKYQVGYCRIGCKFEVRVQLFGCNFWCMPRIFR
jgi:hypothetical protein